MGALWALLGALAAGVPAVAALVWRARRSGRQEAAQDASRRTIEDHERMSDVPPVADEHDASERLRDRANKRGLLRE